MAAATSTPTFTHRGADRPGWWHFVQCASPTASTRPHGRRSGSGGGVATAAQHHSAGAVVVTSDVTSGGLVHAIRTDTDLSGPLSTVDSIHSPQGIIAVPLALADRIAGVVDQYGSGRRRRRRCRTAPCRPSSVSRAAASNPRRSDRRRRRHHRLMGAGRAGARPRRGRTTAAVAAGSTCWRRGGGADEERWTRTNHRGEPVSLLEGPAVGAGLLPAAPWPAGVRPRRRWWPRPEVWRSVWSTTSPRTPSTARKGLRGHLGAMAHGELTTGGLKVLGIGATSVRRRRCSRGLPAPGSPGPRTCSARVPCGGVRESGEPARPAPGPGAEGGRPRGSDRVGRGRRPGGRRGARRRGGRPARRPGGTRHARRRRRQRAGRRARDGSRPGRAAPRRICWQASSRSPSPARGSASAR